MSKFIEIGSNWYVRADVIRDIWLSKSDGKLNVLNVSYVGFDKSDSINCDTEEFAKERLTRIVNELNDEDYPSYPRHIMD